MQQLESDTTWIKQGRQKSAVARVLQKPMTPSEIWRASRVWNHHIQLRDVWHILRQCERRGLVRCFSHHELNGKVYYWTDQARAVIEAAFGTVLLPAPQGISWAKYSRVARSKLRRLVLHELTQARLHGDRAKTATGIRQNLKQSHPVSLNPVIHALKELHSLKLVQISGQTERRGQKLYRLTAHGKHIADLLALRTDLPQALLNPIPSFLP